MNPVAPVTSTPRPDGRSALSMGWRSHSAGRECRSAASTSRIPQAAMPAASRVSSTEKPPCEAASNSVGCASQPSNTGAIAMRNTPNSIVSTVCNTRSNADRRRVRSSTTKSIAVIATSISNAAAMSNAQAPCHSRHASARKTNTYTNSRAACSHSSTRADLRAGRRSTHSWFQIVSSAPNRVCTVSRENTSVMAIPRWRRSARSGKRSRRAADA